MKVRVKFTKGGDLRFVGHLDYMHYFQKAMLRAGIPICYSGGYSPHQIMSFASPLGVGLTSSGEYMDIEVSESDDSATMIDRLNAVMAEGASVVSFKQLPDDAGNAMASIAAADYRVTFREAYAPADWAEFSAKFSAFLAKESILVEKKTKKSTFEVDIRPRIFDAKIEDGSVYLKLASSSADYLKPEMVFSAFYAEQGEEMPPFAIRIHRLDIYTRIAGEDGEVLASLDSLGKDIL